jgi:transcription antitermination factor NusA-like protein
MFQVSIDAESLLEFFRWVLTYLGLPGLALFIVGFVLWHYEKVVERYRLFHSIFSGRASARERGKLRARIQEDINATVLRLQKEVPELFSETVKVSWLEEGIDHVNVRPGSIFIRVGSGIDQDKVFLSAVRCFLDRGLLPEARRYIHGHVMRAARLVLTERFVQRSTFRSAQSVFRSEYYDPTLAEDSSMRGPVKTFELLSHQGLLTRVFLRECSLLPDQLGLRHETTGPKYDVLGFLDYLDELFRGLEQDQLVREFEYSNDAFQVAFAVLADPARARSSGLGFYKWRTKQSIVNGARTIYVVALGERNSRLAANLASWLHRQGLVRSYRFSEYAVSMRGSSLLAVCGVCLVSSTIDLSRTEEDFDTPVVDDENLQQILETTVPEIRSGVVDVVKTALLEGDEALVIVHSSVPHINAVGACVGRGADRVREIRTAAEMKVRFVRWSPDITGIAKDCLEIAKEDYVTDVEIEPVMKLVVVYVSSENSLRELENAKTTIRLTEAITEHDVVFQLDHEALIRSAVTEAVPEVADGSIAIEKIVQFPGIITRVQVSSFALYNPAGVCAHHLGQIARRTKSADTGRICFSEKREDRRETITSALYPLQAEDIVAIEFVGPDKACVLVADEKAQAKAVGKEGAYVKSSSKLAGCWLEIEVEDAT